MGPAYSVRPHLLDEAAIREAIFCTGLQTHERGQISEILVEKYAVDLDMLAQAFATLGSVVLEDGRFQRAA